jgi:non-ribosomal peptide synthetase component F
LVLRTQLQPDLTFRELLRRVKDTSVEAYAHQDLPFEWNSFYRMPTPAWSSRGAQ